MIAKRALSFVASVSILLVAAWLMLHRSPPIYPYMAMDTANNLSVGFLLNGQNSLTACESTIADLASTVLEKCPACRIKRLECLSELNSEQERQRSSAPLSIPSARMSKGVVLYTSRDPELALSACKESERQSTFSRDEATRVTCFPPEVPRPLASKQDLYDIAKLTSWRIGSALILLCLTAFFLFKAWRPDANKNLAVQYWYLSQLASLSRRSKQMIIFASDIFVIVVSLFISFYIYLEQFTWPRGESIWLFVVGPLLAIPIFIRLGMYRAITRYLGIQAMATVFKAVVLYIAIFALTIYLLGMTMPRTVLLAHGVLALLFAGATRLIARYLFNKIQLRGNALQHSRRNILIYGAGSAGVQLASALEFSRELRPVAFVDDDPLLHNKLINGLKVHGPDSLGALLDHFAIREILLAMPSTQRSRRNEIMRVIKNYPVTVLTLPGMDELAGGAVKIEELRELDIEDLLGRDPVPADTHLLTQNIEGKAILVTGAAGSIGSELSRQIMSLRPKRLVLLDHNEFGLYQIERELLNSSAEGRDEARPELIAILGTVTDQAWLKRVMRRFGIETIFHAAAYKHVPMVESNPAVGAYNNILGTWRAAHAALDSGVGTFVLISTDKAVRPTNTMGTTKRFAELILQALAASDPDKTRFTMVRFGNVLGSSGSVVPLFREQLRRGGPITVTDPRITRYFMTIPEAAQLVIQAGAMGKDGDVFVLDMGEPVKILDLAHQMIGLSGLTVRDENHPEGDIEVVFTGLRPGEKLYEELLIGDNVTQTRHPRIMRANEESLPLQAIEDYIRRLEDILQRNATDELRALLMESVRGFSPQCGNEDLLARDPLSTVPYSP